MSDDERAIREVMAAWMTASSAGDTSRILGLMTDDAVFLVPGREPFGKEAFASANRGMRNVKLEGTNEVEELQILGDWAFCVSRVAVKGVLPDEKPFKRAGRTLSLFRKDGTGNWRLARDANLMTDV
jgi:uncharacterized protein (TIGR02246 family)